TRVYEGSLTFSDPITHTAHVPCSVRLRFSFRGYADPRGLHSFPTRRSSDLPRRDPSGGGARSSAPAPGRSRGHRRPSAPPCPPRSEEHTSELQSQSNLVCRLLLEKKKILHELVHILQHHRSRDGRAPAPRVI